MSRLRIPLAAALCVLAAALCALAVGACGSQQPRAGTTAVAARGSTHRSHVVRIYSSLPSIGPEAAASRQIEEGIGLALSQLSQRGHRPHVAAYQIKYRALSDTVRRRRGWSLAKTAAEDAHKVVSNAETAARNPDTIAYIGDLDSAATELSLPILNQAGIVQITPGSGYPGLTDYVKGVTPNTAPPEPGRYYPQGNRTLLRLIPNDLVQAAAAVQLLQRKDCRQLGIWQFGGDKDTAALTAALRQTAGLYKIAVEKVGPLPKVASIKSYESYLHPLAAELRCAVVTGRPSHAITDFTYELHEQLPVGSLIVGTSGLCNHAWTGSLKPAVAEQVDSSLYCTTPLARLSTYHGAAGFIAAFRARYHRTPHTYAYYGYQAAKLVFTAMVGLPGNFDYRSQMLVDLTHGAASGPLGTFDNNGNIYPSTYAVDRIVHGFPRFDLKLTPRIVL